MRARETDWLANNLDERGVRRLTWELAVAAVGYPVSMGIAFLQPLLSLVLFVALALFQCNRAGHRRPSGGAKVR
jgi:hypothetical protein